MRVVLHENYAPIVLDVWVYIGESTVADDGVELRKRIEYSPLEAFRTAPPFWGLKHLELVSYFGACEVRTEKGVITPSLLQSVPHTIFSVGVSLKIVGAALKGTPPFLAGCLGGAAYFVFVRVCGF